MLGSVAMAHSQQSSRRSGFVFWSFWRGGLAVLVGALMLLAPGFASEEEAALWRALRSGEHLVLMRHAIAPGTGDPAAFTLGDCRTQRTLSDEGRDQATRIGARFRDNGIAAAAVYSSQWCRSFETAQGLGLGPPQALPALNSFFQDYEQRPPQTRKLKEWIAAQTLDKPLVLVTHQVNITALTGVYPASGELVILRRSQNGELEVVGTLETD